MKAAFYSSSSNNPIINPTRSQIIRVNQNLCNLRDSDDWPIFDAFIDWLIFNNPAKANDWASRLARSGSTHINIDLSGDYNENLGWAPRYPIPGTDWTGDLNKFKYILRWVQNKGFIPHIHLAADGQGYDPNGMTYGYYWGLTALPGILGQLKEFHNNCLWNAGWDGCFPNWSPAQFASFYYMLRHELGNNAQLAAEFGGPGTIGYCHLGNGAADWAIGAPLDLLDVFCTELQEWPLSEENGVQQVSARLLGPAKRNIQPQNDGSWYLPTNRTRGELGVSYWETLAWWAIRKFATPGDAVVSAQVGQKYGFSNFGNGLP